MRFEELVDIVAKLRGPDGCPWDREQTRETLKPYLVEEFYELIDALDDGDPDAVKEELGDLLFQIVLQSQLSNEEKKFNIHNVVEGISEKMIRRHPHVFGDHQLETSADVSERWQEHKRKEGKIFASVMDGVPRALPALIRASQLQMKATKVGFDWKKVEDMFEKLDEEIREFKDALGKKKQDEMEDELGDILFVLVRIANFVNVNAEDALSRTITKFIIRFNHIEAAASEKGRELTDMNLAEMEVLWNEAKKKNSRFKV
jgi:tetrapyrrole methylase family protein/MazG family protein